MHKSTFIGINCWNNISKELPHKHSQFSRTTSSIPDRDFYPDDYTQEINKKKHLTTKIKK